MRVNKTACAVFYVAMKMSLYSGLLFLINIVVYDDITVIVICRTRYVVLFLMCNHI